MPLPLPSVDFLKDHARARRDQSAAEGTKMPYSAALEATAKAYGYKDWNTICALSKAANEEGPDATWKIAVDASKKLPFSSSECMFLLDISRSTAYEPGGGMTFKQQIGLEVIDELNNQYEGLEAKWEIDGQALVQKLDKLERWQMIDLHTMIHSFFFHNRTGFDTKALGRTEGAR